VSALGDWLPPGEYQGCCPEGPAVSAPCFLHKSLCCLADMAEILGLEQDSRGYKARAAELKEALNRVYFDPETACYRLPCAEYRQAPHVLALALGLAPEEHRGAMVKRLVRDIEERDCHLNTGILATKYLLSVLSENGGHALAWKLITQKTCPSWGYFTENGDTIWESWGPETRSKNHCAFGAVMAWAIRYLAGFAPGKHGVAGGLLLAPKPAGGLRHCRYKIRGKQGEISVRWEIADGVFTVDIEVPNGVDTCVELPDGSRIAKAKTGRYGCRV
jgi:alpha-L-rhamnosidase